MTPKEQINEAVVIAQRELSDTFKKFEQLTGYNITNVEIVRSHGHFGESKLLGVTITHTNDIILR